MEFTNHVGAIAEAGGLRFHDFEPWFLDIVEDVRPNLVISVARGAVRFIQLTLSPQSQGRVRHLSQHAIPFLLPDDLDDARVLVFDDSVIFGSTMNSVKDRLERRGARVDCISYVVDRTHFLGQSPSGSRRSTPASPYSTLPLTSKHRLWPDDVRRHHALLVESVLLGGLHYNLDFPTFCIRLEECTLQDAPYISHLISKVAAFRVVADVSTPVALQSQTLRYSALLNQQSWEWLRCESLHFRPYGKVRVTYVPRHNAILLTPVLQLAMRENVSFEDIVFCEPDADRLWRKLRAPQEINNDGSHRALFRLATAFAGIALGVSVCDDVVSAIGKEFHVLSTILEPLDMRLVLGEENSQTLASICDHLSLRHPRTVRTGAGNEVAELAELANAPELRSKIKNAFRTNSSLAPDTNDLPCESVGKVFLAIRGVTDSEMVRHRNPSPDRLDTGLTYEGIRSVLSDTMSRQPLGDELSLCIDLCVDQGLAVPKIVRENGAWFRAFYCGENEDNQDTLQFKAALHAAYNAYLKRKGSHYLSPFDLQKLCVVMKDVMPWIPISTGPSKFGYTSAVGDQQLIGWLTQGQRPPFLERWEGNRRIITVAPDYQSPVRCMWQPAQTRDFSDAFDFTATAFCKVPDEAKLLLTTCRTHRHMFNAIAFELWSWIDYKEPSFGTFLVAVERLMADHEVDAKESLHSLYWVVRYISEAWKKYRIFTEDYAKLKGILEKGFSSIDPAGKRWWDYLCGCKLFDGSHVPGIDDRLKSIMALLEQMTRLTAFSLHLLLQSSILTKQAVQDAFGREGTSLTFPEFGWLTRSSCLIRGKEYNDAILAGRLPGKSILLTPITLPSDEGLSRAQVSLMMQGVRICFDELSTAIRAFCPRYRVNEGDFPFSPDHHRRQLDDGSIERDLRNVFILTMDIIKGTNSQQTNEMKIQIRQVLQDFSRKGLVFQDTGDDTSVACCQDVGILWDAADSIRIHGANLKLAGDPFGGTRKGLSFGSLTVLTKTNGETLLHDLTKTNAIPAACGILPGIDANVPSDRRNDALIMQERLLDQCADKLRLDKSAATRVVFAEKHFTGTCYIVYLA